jgi:hypothetical protein
VLLDDYIYAQNPVIWTVVTMQDEIKPQPSDTGDYISLSTVRNAFLDFSGFLFGGLEFIVLSIRKSLLVFIICCLIGVAVGYLYYRLTNSRIL